MIRRQIYLDEDLARRLRRAAAARRRTVSALIREAIARYVADPTTDPMLRFIGGSRGGRPDASANHDRYLYGSDLDAKRRRR